MGINLNDITVHEELLKFRVYKRNYSPNFSIKIAYRGSFNKLVLKRIGTFILELFPENIKIGKRIFKIFIELAQNISYYSCERERTGKETGIGSMVFIETPKFYKLFSINKIKTEDKIKLESKLKKINSHDIKGLKKFKREQLDLPDSQFGGANIGLIQITLDSENSLKMEFIPTSDSSYQDYLLFVKINR